MTPCESLEVASLSMLSSGEDGFLLKPDCMLENIDILVFSAS